MGIRTKNLHNYVIQFKLNKTLSATLNADIAKVPFSGFISNIVGKIQTAGSGVTSTILDIHLNGTTIFSEATKITFAATTGVASYGALTSTPTSVTYGSILSVDVDQVATNPLNAIVEVTVSRTPINTASHSEDQDPVM